jgi:cyclic nucleotide gated channel, plant
MILKFRIAFVAPSSRVFGRGELVRDPDQIAIRYLKNDFIIDLAAMLPIPQVRRSSCHCCCVRLSVSIG